MGTIVARKRKNGTMAYMAKIIIEREGKVVHRESKTFDRKPAAAAWMAKREDELSQPGAIERAATEHVTLADAIDRYIAESRRQIGKTKAQVLNAIKRDAIAAKRCDRIGSSDIVSFARNLAATAQPSTVGNYLSHLSSIFTVANPAWQYPLDPQAMDDARVVAQRLGIIAKSRSRERRPTLDELDRIMSHFAARQVRRPSSVPMVHIIAFAIFSTRRQEEIVRITWEDFDAEHTRVMVRDMKHPGEKIGNDTWCELPPEAVRIIEAMPRQADQIFPYGTDAISAAFTRACKLLDIADLRFHDLRHEGISWLFEMGRDIPRAALVSGHRSWQSLQRYTHILKRGNKYAEWKWLDAATTAPSLKLTQNGDLPRRLRSERQSTATRA